MSINIEALKVYSNLYDNAERKELISKSLEGFRKANKLQQKEVAEYLGINAQTYSAYEKGRNEAPAEILVRLSILYDVSLDILMQRDNMSKTEKSALDQLEMYDKQIAELKVQLLQGDPKAQEQFGQFINGLEKLTDAIRDQTKNK